MPKYLNHVLQYYYKYVAEVLLFTYHLGTSLMVNNECGDAGKKQRSSTILDLECDFWSFYVPKWF